MFFTKKLQKIEKNISGRPKSVVLIFSIFKKYSSLDIIPLIVGIMFTWQYGVFLPSESLSTSIILDI
jgi:hypothetical protein